MAEEHADVCRMLAEGLPGMVWVADARGAVRFASREAREFLGDSAAEFGAGDWGALLHPRDRAAAAAEVRAAVREARPARRRVRLRRWDGEWRRVDATLTPRLDAGGALAGFVAVATELGDGDAADARLRENEERLRRAQESARLGTWEWDLGSGRMCWSDGVYALMGLDPAGVTASPELWRALVIPEDLDRVDAALEAALAGSGEFSLEYRVRRTDGCVRWLSAHGRLEPGPEGGSGRLLGVTSDITARKATEEALQASEARLGTLITQLPVGVGLTDLGGRLTVGNPFMRRYVPEVVPSRDAARALRWRAWGEDGSVLPQSRWPAARALRGESVAPGLEMLYRHDDGREEWLLVSAVPSRSADGAIDGSVLFLQEIDERKRAEEMLARQTRELGALFSLTDRLQRAQTLEGVCAAALDSIREALGAERASVLLLDDGGVMRFVAWRGLSDGYRAAVEGHSPWQRGAKDPQPVLIEDVARAELPDALRATVAAEGIAALAFIPLLVDGELVGKFMVYYAGPHRFGREELDLAVAIGRQLAFGVQRVRGQEALRASEERYRAAFEVANVGQVQVDAATGRFLLVNDAYCAITGRTRAELLGLTPADLLHPEDRERTRAALAEFMRGERDAYSMEQRYVRPGGDVAWVRVNASMVRDGAGRPLHTVAVVEDITASRLASERARRLNEELERFASVASHDLREPLRGMALQAEFVLEDEPGLTAASRERLERISVLSGRLAAMIKGLLEYARSGGEPRRERCDLSELAGRAVDKLADSLREQGAEVALAGPLPVVEGDPVLLERVFANLIVNGVKHNTSTPKRVQIGSADGAVYVMDNGVGIAPEHHASVFRIFTRLPGKDPEGVGLGLALVKNIVEAHGGAVSLRSQVGAGSTFVLQFPGAAASAAT